MLTHQIEPVVTGLPFDLQGSLFPTTQIDNVNGTIENNQRFVQPLPQEYPPFELPRRVPLDILPKPVLNRKRRHTGLDDIEERIQHFGLERLAKQYRDGAKMINWKDTTHERKWLGYHPDCLDRKHELSGLPLPSGNALVNHEIGLSRFLTQHKLVTVGLLGGTAYLMSQ